MLMTDEKLACLEEGIAYLRDRMNRRELSPDVRRRLQSAIKLARSRHGREEGTARVSLLAKYVRLMTDQLADFNEMAAPN
jgi:hypothetical protein